ncbi:DnaJ-domain-containing protein [Russula ochroleuca]|jgi:curved DNA-binding protein CbpA|uniref:DnaJ-domain-containing protein n=1 Tax=Russula ochroleuca TaxID=152965 RepID=A0A9P5MXQ3_9AGAM|nr:DnaJ-domain-containing protein [Russula ochroleuca]
MASFPDYYGILNVPKNASTEDIRQAYKRESLKTHPDRLLNASNEEKKASTEKFQAVADAYYVLSDPQRRSEYDRLSSSRPSSERTNDPSASSNFFRMFSGMFTSGAGDGQSGTAQEQRPNADRVFGDVFEDLLRPEVERHLPVWSWLGSACGAGLGFITANVPGLVVGAYAGNRLGAIRDAKGKSVAAVFAELGARQKVEILHALALKVLGTLYT